MKTAMTSGIIVMMLAFAGCNPDSTSNESPAKSESDSSTDLAIKSSGDNLDGNMTVAIPDLDAKDSSSYQTTKIPSGFSLADGATANAKSGEVLKTDCATKGGKKREGLASMCHVAILKKGGEQIAVASGALPLTCSAVSVDMNFLEVGKNYSIEVKICGTPEGQQEPINLFGMDYPAEFSATDGVKVAIDLKKLRVDASTAKAAAK